VKRDAYRHRADARLFETLVNAYALRAGLVAAAQYALDMGLNKIQERAWSLAGDLRSSLSSLSNVDVRDTSAENCAIISFVIKGHEPRKVIEALRDRGIVIGMSDPSSTRLDAERRDLPVLLRAAPHYYNTEEEIGRLTRAIGLFVR